MLTSCPSCNARYNLTAAQLGPQGRNLKCAKCGHQWFVPPEDPNPEPDLDIPPPIPPTNGVGLDEMAFVGNQPVWWRKFGASLTLWLVLAVGALAVALAVALWLLLTPPEGETTATGPAAITDPQPTNLTLSDLSRDILEDGALVILKFTGTVTNNGKTTQTVPELRLQLLDKKGIELDFWPADVAKPSLEAGESTRWTARFLNPPLDRIATWRAFFKTNATSPLVPAQVTTTEEISPTQQTSNTTLE